MGVDYLANYGIGIQISNDIDFDWLDLDGVECMDDYIEHIIKTNEIELEWFAVGDQSYSGEKNSYYICIKDLFSEGHEMITSKIEKFKKYLSSKDIETVGEIGLYGGMEIC